MKSGRKRRHEKKKETGLTREQEAVTLEDINVEKDCWPSPIPCQPLALLSAFAIRMHFPPASMSLSPCAKCHFFLSHLYLTSKTPPNAPSS